MAFVLLFLIISKLLVPLGPGMVWIPWCSLHLMYRPWLHWPWETSMSQGVVGGCHLPQLSTYSGREGRERGESGHLLQLPTGKSQLGMEGRGRD